MFIYSQESGLWIGTEYGLNHYEKSTDSFQRYYHDPTDLHGLGHNRINALYENTGGRLLIGTPAGAELFDPREERFSRLPLTLESSRDFVTSFFEDQRGLLWVGTDMGELYRFDSTDREAVRLDHDPRDGTNLSGGTTIAQIFEDRSGGVWVATSGGGLLKYSRACEQFYVYRKWMSSDLSLRGDWANSVHEDDNGTIWVGTRQGLDRIDRQRGKTSHHASDQTYDGALYISKIHEDRSGTILIGTYGAGVFRFDRDSERLIAYQHEEGDRRGLRDNRVKALLTDRKNRLWVATPFGLDYLDPNRGFFVHFRAIADDGVELDHDWIRTITEDASGRLWFGSAARGVFVLDTESRLIHLEYDPTDAAGLSSNRISTIFKSSTGVVWIGTMGSGIDRVSTDRFEVVNYSRANGLPNNNVNSILEDDDGYLWIGTDRGLVKFDPRSERFETYDADDGLPSEFFLHESAFRGRGGELFFGTDNGLVTFHPRRLEKNKIAPLLALTRILLFNEEVRPGDPSFSLDTALRKLETITLTHEQNVFSLEFAALHYVNPKKNRYSYRLEGFDDDWIRTGADKRFAHYTNLDAGTYVFRLRGSNHDGVWSDQERKLTIVVEPAPWKTWWAYSAYVLLAAAALLLFVRRLQWRVEKEQTISRRLREVDRLKDALLTERTQELREREQLLMDLERFHHTVSHDLKNPLVTIHNFLGMARRDVARGHTAEAERDLGRVTEAAREMERLFEELLRFSRAGKIQDPQLVVADELIKMALDRFDPPLAERGVDLEIAPGLPEIYGDPALILVVLEHLIDNAARFMGDEPAPRIRIGVEDRGNGPVLYVRDNGIGIDAKYHERIFELFERLDTQREGTGVGLALCRRIAKAHGGDLRVESMGSGHGSTFYLTLGVVPVAWQESFVLGDRPVGTLTPGTRTS